MSEKNRNIIVRVALLIMLVLVVCLVSGCSQKSEPAAPAVVTPEVAAVPDTAEAANEEVTEEMIAEAALAEEAADETAEAAEVSLLPAEKILLATVNGKEIYTDDDYLAAFINYNAADLEDSGYDLTNPGLIESLRQYGLHVTIQNTLLHQKSAEYGLDQFTDEEIASVEAEAKTKWATIVDSYAAQYGLITDTSTDEEKVAARAQIEASFKAMEDYDEARYISDSVESYQENLMAERLMDRLTEGKTISDEDVMNYFNDLVNEDREQYGDSIDMYEFYTNYYGQPSYYVPEGYRGITHILLKVDEELLNNWKDLSARLEEQKADADSEPTDAEATPTDLENAETEAPAEPTATPAPTPEPVTQEMVDAAEKAILDSVQSTVDEINAKLAAGASFDDLIKEYGTDPGMQDDATRAQGYPVHKDSIVYDSAFTNAAMALEKVGDIGKPFVSQFGVHILQYLRDIPAGAKELTDEMKAEFSATLLEEMRTSALTDAIEQWENESAIVYTEAGEAWKIPAEGFTDELPDEEAAPAEADAEAPAEEPAAEAPAAEEAPNP
ncbi:MAG: peptidylprolyl isomerase [Clostridia bacterium]|nr:peptidylprolyl isomerase [Clostridia bacterium]